jgi:hypothetical protein
VHTARSDVSARTFRRVLMNGTKPIEHGPVV